jgi:hypothetical protein
MFYVGERVWIKHGSWLGRSQLPEIPVLVEITSIESQNSFRAVTVDKTLTDCNYMYNREEVFQPNTRKGKFIGGVQRFQ